jgi:hypothetical protein
LMLSLLVYLFLVHVWNRKFSGICYEWLLSQNSSSRSKLYSFRDFLFLCHRVSVCNFVLFLTLQLSVIHFAATWEGWSCCFSSSATINATWSSGPGKCWCTASFDFLRDKMFHHIAFVVMLVVHLLFCRWERNWLLKTDKGIKKSRRSVLECTALDKDFSCECFLDFVSLCYFWSWLISYLPCAWWLY